MTATIAGVLVGVFIALALVHVYWALGGRVGRSAAVPEANGRPAFVPGRAATLGVAGALLAAALVVALAAGLTGGPPVAPLARILTAVLGAILLARAIGDFRRVGFFKREQGGAFARLDTLAYSPLCLLLGTGCLLIARGAG